MPRPVKLLLVLGVLAAVIYIVSSSMGTSKLSCEVCVELEGREACRTARGSTREEAIQTAHDNACAQITNGRTESILCGGIEPKTVTCSD